MQTNHYFQTKHEADAFLNGFEIGRSTKKATASEPQPETAHVFPWKVEVVREFPPAVIKVEIRRAEGPINDPTMRPGIFEGESAVEQANDWLKRIAQSAPAEGGYDKTDVTITLSSTDKLYSRFDVMHTSCADNDTDLIAHFRTELLFACAPEKLPHIANNPARLAQAKKMITHTQLREARRLLWLLCPDEKV